MRRSLIPGRKAAKLPALLLAASLLGGCAEMACRLGPQQQELGELESLYDTAQGNVDRGYAIHESLEPEWEPYETEETVGGDARIVTKYRSVWRTVETPVAIDVDAEKRKALRLRSEILRLRPAAEREFSACMARNR